MRVCTLTFVSNLNTSHTLSWIQACLLAGTALTTLTDSSETGRGMWYDDVVKPSHQKSRDEDHIGIEGLTV